MIYDVIIFTDTQFIYLSISFSTLLFNMNNDKGEWNTHSVYNWVTECRPNECRVEDKTNWSHIFFAFKKWGHHTWYDK
jgi:hypothetical protein